ncbi:hypothetical protein BGZ80_005933, partial [Entomortierella chlamydospora]
NYAEPMTRQPSEASSVRTLQAGGSEDGLAPTESLQDHQQKALIGMPRSLDLPTDRRRPTESSSAGSEYRSLLEAPLKQFLTSLRSDSGFDLTTVMLAAWSIVLSRLSVEDSIVIGMGHVNEMDLSSNALPVHIDLSGEPNTLQLLERVKHAVAVAAAHLSVKVDSTIIPAQKMDLAPYQAAFYSHNGVFLSRRQTVFPWSVISRCIYYGTRRMLR